MIHPNIALQLLTKPEHILTADKAFELGIVDKILSSDCPSTNEETIELAMEYASSKLVQSTSLEERRLKHRNRNYSALKPDSKEYHMMFPIRDLGKSRSAASKAHAHPIAPWYAEKALQLAIDDNKTSFSDGVQLEEELCKELAKHPQTVALHYFAMSEKKLNAASLVGGKKVSILVIAVLSHIFHN